MSAERRRVSTLRPLALGTVSLGAAMVIGTLEPDRFLPLATSVAVLAVALAMPIPVPWGGTVPVGYAVVVPLTASGLSVDHQIVVATLAVAIVVIDRGAGRSWEVVPRLAVRLVLALGTAIATSAALGWLAPGGATVGGAVVVASAVAVVDAVVARFVAPHAERIEVASAVPVYLAVTSTAALAAVTVDQVGILMAGVAVLPLLLARFSFQRYATANATLEQTVLALGFVPELVGLASIGQSERVAHYADRLAESLGFDRRSRQRIVIASRLHRLGAVRFDEEGDPEVLSRHLDDPAELAAEGARILHRSGFPDEITELVSQARAGSLEGPAPSLEAAVIRVAVAFDAVVGEEPARARLGLARVSEWAAERNGRRTVAALSQLVHRRETFVLDAVEAGQRFRHTTDDLDLERLFAAGRGEALPTPRRST